MWFLSESPVVTWKTRTNWDLPTSAHTFTAALNIMYHQIIITCQLIIMLCFFILWGILHIFLHDIPWHTWYILVLPLQDTAIAVTTLREVIHSSSAIIWALSASKISWLWTATIWWQYAWHLVMGDPCDPLTSIAIDGAFSSLHLKHSKTLNEAFVMQKRLLEYHRVSITASVRRTDYLNTFSFDELLCISFFGDSFRTTHVHIAQRPFRVRCSGRRSWSVSIVVAAYPSVRGGSFLPG